MATKDNFRLTATFRVRLPSEVLISRPQEDDLSYSLDMDGFITVLRFVVDDGWSSQLAGEPYKTVGVDSLLISVSRLELVSPPEVILTPEGQRDYSLQSPYFHERLPDYQKVAREVVERAIVFFKYVLQQPHLSFSFDYQDFQNPTWTDETGQKYVSGGIFVVSAIHGIPPELSVKRYTRDDDEKLQNALENRLTPCLFEELLSDAQTAFFEGNLRRAILELAISCEVMVKQFFFSGSSITSGVFEYFEEKSPSGVRVTELIDPAAKRAFGESFKETNRDSFRKIDHLFRCRNKVAHRGEIAYRDDGGRLHQVDKEEFRLWWESVEILKSWLDSHR